MSMGSNAIPPISPLHNLLIFLAWPTVFYDFKTGEKDMDIRSGYLKDAQLHGLKVINWTIANAQRGLPPLIGVILVFDTETGLPLGLLDGRLITGLRTGCAGAVGARYLARRDSRTLFVLGTGPQAFYQVGRFSGPSPGCAGSMRPPLGTPSTAVSLWTSSPSV